MCDGYRDMLVDGYGEDATLSPLKAEVERNPMLWQKVQTRLVLPASCSLHAHKMFLLAPMIMEDRESFVLLKDIVKQFSPLQTSHSLHQRRCFQKMMFVCMVRRVFRSNPILWSHLYPLLVEALESSSMLCRFDFDAIPKMVETISQQLQLPIAKLYGTQ